MKIRLLLGLAIVGALTVGAGVADAQPNPPSRHVLYVANWASDNISTFRLADDGSLITPATLTDVPAGTHQPLAAAESPSGRFLYVTNWGSGGVSTFAIADDGTLIAVTTSGSGLVNSAGIAVSAEGDRLYVANFNDRAAGTLSTFGIGSDGVPTLLSTQDSRGSGAAGIALSPDGHTLAVANMGSGDISLFQIGLDGMPRWVATRGTAAGAFFPAFARDGRHVIVANAEANSLSVVAVDDAADPRLITTVPSAGDGPRGIAVDAAGTAHVAHYADGTGGGSVTSFAIANNGQPTQLGDPVGTGGNGAEAIVALDNSLYVANFNTGGPGSLSTFALRPGAAPTLIGKPTMTGGSEPDFGSIVIHRLVGPDQ